VQLDSYPIEIKKFSSAQCFSKQAARCGAVMKQWNTIERAQIILGRIQGTVIGIKQKTRYPLLACHPYPVIKIKFNSTSLNPPHRITR